MSILVTIDVNGHDITGQFETMTYQSEEYVIVSETANGDHVGVLMDKAKVKKFDASFGLATPRFYQGKLLLNNPIVIPRDA